MSVLTASSYENVISRKQARFSSSQKDNTSNTLAPVNYKDVDEDLFYISQEYSHLSKVLSDLEKKPVAENAKLLEAVKERTKYFAEQMFLKTEKYYGPASAEAQEYAKKIHEITGQSFEEKPVYMDVATLRNLLGIANVYRLSIVFSRLTWKNFWLWAREVNWLNKYDKLGGIPINIGIMDAPTDIFNALSVTFFASRFLVNTAVVLKHTFFPEDYEKDIPMFSRFLRELDKYHWTMVNDIVWAVVNGLTNYAFYFHIAASTATWVLAAFLFFDFLWLAYRVFLEEKNYFAMKTRYEVELKSEEEGSANWTILQMQLEKLENARYEMNATLLFCGAAAFLIGASFSTILFFSSPLVLPISFFMVTVGVAMYMSCGQFGAYMKERMICERDKTDATAKNEAGYNFAFSMAKNTFAPLLIVGLFTISWQAALVAAIVYVGYELSASMQAPDDKKPLISKAKTLFHDKETRHDKEESDASVVVPVLAT